MKAEIVEGKWKKAADEDITIETKEGSEKYPLDEDFYLREDFVVNNLGDDVEVVLMNGKVKNIRLKEQEVVTPP